VHRENVEFLGASWKPLTLLAADSHIRDLMDALAVLSSNEQNPSIACALTVQHRWMRSKKNVKPEIAWSQFRRRFTPGFERIIQEGVTAGWYDTTRPLDV